MPNLYRLQEDNGEQNIWGQSGVILKHYDEHIGCMYKYTWFVHMISCTYTTWGTGWKCS